MLVVCCEDMTFVVRNPAVQQRISSWAAGAGFLGVENEDDGLKYLISPSAIRWIVMEMDESEEEAT